jgi:methoxymalonate biosynthesis protein
VTQISQDGTWTVMLLMMSCRAMGRGVIEALLAWLTGAAARGGAAALAVPCVVSPRNVPLRLALTSAGFRADPDHPPPGPQTAVFSRPLSGPPPEVPDWVTGAAASGITEP